MMALTHAAIAATGTSLVLGTSEPLPLGLAILGSQIPDIDTTTSTIGKIFFPISSWIEDHFPHRSITHSLLATVFLTVVSFFVCQLLGDKNFVVMAALPLGHLLSCFSDTFTKQGVQLFYPNPAWAISVSNPRKRLKSGGTNELWVLGIAIALLVLGINLANNGGVTTKVSQSLGLKDGIVRIYNQNAATNKVYAEIQGYWRNDRTSADGRYLILDNQGKEFIIKDDKGIYKTGEQIITTKLITKVGESVRSTSLDLTFNDENAIAKLENLQASNSNSSIYLSGSLEIDFPEDVNLPIESKQMPTASLSGSGLRFNYCPINKAIRLLKDQYAIGSIKIKIYEN